MSVFAHKTDKSKFTLGNESDLSGIGDGTAFGAIKTLNENGKSYTGTFSQSYITAAAQTQTQVGTITLNKGTYLLLATLDSNTIGGHWEMFIDGINCGSKYNQVSYDNTLNGIRSVTVNSDNTTISLSVWAESAINIKAIEFTAHRLHAI